MAARSEPQYTPSEADRCRKITTDILNTYYTPKIEDLERRLKAALKAQEGLLMAIRDEAERCPDCKKKLGPQVEELNRQ